MRKIGPSVNCLTSTRVGSNLSQTSQDQPEYHLESHLKSLHTLTAHNGLLQLNRPVISFPPFLSFTVYITSRRKGVTILLHSSYAPFPDFPVGQNGVR
jgi:hypothetical protein